eukprot:Rhum_TRINITY_DN14830_c0_g1::Rhum_TRINITY_DN14830_c0_g1_i6::g.120928::m.120928
MISSAAAKVCVREGFRRQRWLQCRLMRRGASASTPRILGDLQKLPTESPASVVGSLKEWWSGGVHAEDEELSEDDVRSLRVVPHYDYAVLSEHVYGDGSSRPLPEGWEEYMNCSDLSLDREGFGAAAYINTELQHVVIAKRGTIDAASLRAGVWVYSDEPTIQFMLAEQFSIALRLKLDLEEKSDYTVSYTGHSLGGVLATCRAVAEQTFAIVFETPGCRGFVERTMYPFKYDDADIIVYLRPPNTINTLKPQVGHVVQLPPQDVVQRANEAASEAASEADENAQQTIVQMLPSLPSTLSPFPNVAEFMGKKILERSVPAELYDYLSRLEPVVRDLFNETQQVHSIHNIVPLFEDARGCCCEPEGSDIALVWPTHPMQFFEYNSSQKSLEDVRPDEPHLRSAYEELQRKIYQTRKRNKHEIPLTWLKEDDVKLISHWQGLSPSKKRSASLPFTSLDRRVLNACWIGRENVKCKVISAFQMKQYLFILKRRDEVRDFVSRL